MKYSLCEIFDVFPLGMNVVVLVFRLKGFIFLTLLGQLGLECVVICDFSANLVFKRGSWNFLQTICMYVSLVSHAKVFYMMC